MHIFLTHSNLGNNEQAEYLKNKFSEELCILWLIHKDNNQAKQYLKSGMESFLNDWHLINPMFGNLRYVTSKLFSVKLDFHAEYVILGTIKC